MSTPEYRALQEMTEFGDLHNKLGRIRRILVNENDLQEALGEIDNAQRMDEFADVVRIMNDLLYYPERGR